MEIKPIVSIARDENIVKAVMTCLDHLMIPDLTGKNILLKPNVGREDAPNLGINTNPDVVKAVFEYLKIRYEANYLIGDSPIINADTTRAFIKSGYSKFLKESNITFIDLDDKPPIEKEIPNSKILNKIKVTGYWNDIDYIISIPVLKFHMHCGASLSFKNLKGLIYKNNKTRLHHLRSPELIEEFGKTIKQVKELDIAISDLSNIMKPDLAIIDASYAQEGMGPSSGNPVKMDTIIASTNFLAADIVAITLTQPKWTLENVPHLKIISDKLPNAPKSILDIKTIPEDFQEFKKTLEPPPKTISIKYPNVNLIDIDSCSACLSTIFNLLKNNKEFIDSHFSTEKPLNLAIGKGIKQSDLYEETYLIGNCTSNNKENGKFIQGCTPVESEIMNKIKQDLNSIKK